MTSGSNKPTQRRPGGIHGHVRAERRSTSPEYACCLTSSSLVSIRRFIKRAVLKGCGADLDQLGADLQRVLQRAVFHVKSSGKEEVGVVDVLVATFSEKQSGAVFLLTRAQVTRVGVVNYMAGSTGHVLPADTGTKSNGTGSPAHGK